MVIINSYVSHYQRVCHMSAHVYMLLQSSAQWPDLGEKEEATSLGRVSQIGKLLTQHCVRYVGTGLRGSLMLNQLLEYAGMCVVYFIYT